jgi:hypothetical protein
MTGFLALGFALGYYTKGCISDVKEYRHYHEIRFDEDSLVKILNEVLKETRDNRNKL